MDGPPSQACPDPSRALSRRVAIVGVGETDYGADYRAERARADGYRPPTLEAMCRLALDRALADAGLEPGEVDALSTSLTYGGPEPEVMADRLGLRPRLAFANGSIMAGPLPRVCAAIADGVGETVAMLFAINGRSAGRSYGGATYTGGEGGTPQSYYYYHPWGWSSQAAHWALAASRYLHEFALSPADTAAIPMQLRRHAQMSPNAVMQAPMSLDDYLASRPIVEPLRLLDMCLVNDGAVCLILRPAALAARAAGAKPPVLVAGWGAARTQGDKLDVLVRQRLSPVLAAAGTAALDMAGLRLADIGHVEAYDAATPQLVNQLEGYGFFEPGTTAARFRAGDASPNGALPVNTAGGMLSGSYMQGWSQVVEVVRQLRGEAGVRQVPGLRVSMSSVAQTDAAHPILYVQGG